MRKTCTKCFQELDLSSFGPSVANRDGRNPRCNSCLAAYAREWRSKREMPTTDAIEKTCYDCKLVKPIEEFRRNKLYHDGRVNQCKPCHNKANCETAKRFYRKYRLRDKLSGKERDCQLRNKFGFTLEKYREMLSAQGGACAICRTATPGKKSFGVDHNHATNALRGLLCGRCNSALGGFKDSEDNLRRAILYLRTHGGARIEPLTFIA